MYQLYDALDTKTATVGSVSPSSLTDFGFSAAHKTAAWKAVITAGANPVRLTWSGVAASSSVGHYLAAYENAVGEGSSNVNNLSVIGVGGDSAVSITIEELRGAP